MFPDWMRQELINLDYASSFQDAQDSLVHHLQPYLGGGVSDSALGSR